MKRKALALTVIMALLFSAVTGTLGAGFCSSDFVVYGDTTVYGIFGRNPNATITVDLPENKAYNVTLAFTFEAPASFDTPAGNTVTASQYLVTSNQTGFSDCYLLSVFILDYDRAKIIDSPWTNLGGSPHSYGAVLSQSGDTYYGSAVLPELSEGSHNLTVWVRAQQNFLSWDHYLWVAFSKTITFTVDTVAPSVLVLSPENRVYNTSDAPLDFTVNEPFSKVAYCLDGQENVAINENTTLTGLPNGDHNVTVYATDEFGNIGVSEIVYFSVEVPFPTMLVAVASVTTVTMVGVGLLIYFKKRKKSGIASLSDKKTKLSSLLCRRSGDTARKMVPNGLLDLAH